MSLEASDIYYHSERQMDLKRDYVGMIPFSLELLKLKDINMKTKYIEDRDKYISDDIINVKFKSKVKNSDEMLDIVDKRIENAVSGSEYESKLISYRETLQSHSSKYEDSSDIWGSIAIPELRKTLYNQGFKIRNINKSTGEIKEVEYVVYKRSSAKSRTGQCLFIRKELFNRMIKWSRMNLPFKKNMTIDLASLLAYESLVGSSLEDLITINVDNILIVDDIDSKFKTKANIVRKNEETGFLDSFYNENADASNSIFDGESLLDTMYFPKGKGMMLLRNHMFKSASFNCNVQGFLRDNCPNELEFDDWTLYNMYGEPIKAKDVHMICTPSSVKALKFSHVLKSKSEKEMWNYWKDKVRLDGNIFGICKYDKSSKLGCDDSGNILQQTSYQMINCLPLNATDVNELIEKEKEYIDRLKHDNDFLMDEIYKNKDLTNSNESLYGLYQYNKGLINTRLFRDFKKFYINRKVTHAKKGKIKINGDYCVLLGNPIELLHHAIGKFDISNFDLVLKNNEVYSSLFNDGEKLVGFRNPNTSPSNVLIAINTHRYEICNYLNLSPNIVVVNAINFPIQDILSGCDYDSDTLLLSNDKKLVEIGDKCFGEYHVCLNHIKGDSKKYKLNEECHYEIDNQLSESQYNIGKVVNLGQLCMSTYWHLVNTESNIDDADILLKKVDVMTVLSGIAIDMAKKFYDLDIHKEIIHVSNNEVLKSKVGKPNFWIFVSQNKKTKDNVTKFECPMDFLMEELDGLKHSNKNKCISFLEFIIPTEIKNVSMRQVNRVNDVIKKYNNEIKAIKVKKNEDGNESYTEIEELSLSTSRVISKWKLKPETIAFILKHTYEDFDSLLLKMVKILYETDSEKLLGVIKKG